MLEAAQKRARELGLPYAGALFPAEAHLLLQAGARLVDIRTQAELYWVGRIPGAVMVEWNSYPGGALNLEFINQLSDFVAPEETTMFICRSGGRSRITSYNVCYTKLLRTPAIIACETPRPRVSWPVRNRPRTAVVGRRARSR